MSPAKAAATILVIAVSAAPTAVAETNLYRNLDWHTPQAARSAVQYALESQPSNQGLAWSVPRVATGVVTPLRTWRSESGHWCREFVEHLEMEGGRRYSAKDTRCRSSDGRWIAPER